MMKAYETTTAAVGRARAGEGPTLIECKTYRWRKHTERPEVPDSRPPEEIEAWKQKDPIKRLTASLIAQGFLSEEAWQMMDSEILLTIKEAVQFARDSPFPDPETASLKAACRC